MGVIRVGYDNIAGVNVNRSKTFSAKRLRNQAAGPPFPKTEQPVQRARS